MCLPLSLCLFLAVITPPPPTLYKQKARVLLLIVVARQLINLSRLLIPKPYELLFILFALSKVMILLKHSQLTSISNIIRKKTLSKFASFFARNKPVREYFSELLVNLVINSLISRAGGRSMRDLAFLCVRGRCGFYGLLIYASERRTRLPNR